MKHATLFRKEFGTTMIPYSFDCYCVPLVNLLSKIISPAWGIPRLIPLPILNYLFQNVEYEPKWCHANFWKYRWQSVTRLLKINSVKLIPNMPHYSETSFGQHWYPILWFALDCSYILCSSCECTHKSSFSIFHT